MTARQMLQLPQAFQKALDDYAKTAAIAGADDRAGGDAVPSQSGKCRIPNGPPRAVRHRLQEERASITHKFSIAGHEGYITVGLYPSGQPGEIFIKMAKEGSTVSGLMDAFATSISLALQHGVPLKVLCEKFAHTRFEPSGWTGNEQIGYAKSLMDYIFRWLNLRFLSGEQLTLFAGLAPQAPQLPASPTHSSGDRAGGGGDGFAGATGQAGRGSGASRLNQVSTATARRRRAAALRRRPSVAWTAQALAARTARACRTAGSITLPTRCATCTRWAMRRAARPAAQSWCATGAAIAA